MSLDALRLLIADLDRFEPDRIADRVETSGISVSDDDCPLAMWLSQQLDAHITVGYDGTVTCDNCRPTGPPNTGGWHIRATFTPLTLQSALGGNRWIRIDLDPDGSVVRFLERFECGHYPGLKKNGVDT